MSNNRISRILIYRLGSIGDITVTLPCFNFIRQRFPQASIALLTNIPTDSRAAPAVTVLQGSGLVDQYLTYPLRTRDFRELHTVRSAIRAFRPDLLVYLVNRSSAAEVFRDYVFFASCGITEAVGMPFKKSQRKPIPPDSTDSLWEAEASRLARSIVKLGSVKADGPEGWDLHLSPSEVAEAMQLLHLDQSSGRIDVPMIGLCIGTKQVVKDWGADNWYRVLEAINRADLGLVLIGSSEEREPSQDVARSWRGPIINLCGFASPRVSAAAIQRLKFLLCHDSGPMHLAAAVGTRCVAVFSKHNLPGQWFPFGKHHVVFYPPPDSHSILDIRAQDVAAAALELVSVEAKPLCAAS